MADDTEYIKVRSQLSLALLCSVMSLEHEGRESDYLSLKDELLSLYDESREIDRQYKEAGEPWGMVDLPLDEELDSLLTDTIEFMRSERLIENQGNAYRSTDKGRMALIAGYNLQQAIDRQRLENTRRTIH